MADDDRALVAAEWSLEEWHPVLLPRRNRVRERGGRARDAALSELPLQPAVPDATIDLVVAAIAWRDDHAEPGEHHGSILHQAEGISARQARQSLARARQRAQSASGSIVE